jgi:hypothetical protein
MKKTALRKKKMALKKKKAGVRKKTLYLALPQIALSNTPLASPLKRGLSAVLFPS